MRIALPAPRVRALVRRLLTAALDAVDPATALRRAVHCSRATLQIGTRRYPLSDFRRIVVVGAGKASARMALALEDILGDRIEHGLVTVKYGHGEPTHRIRIAEAAHPIPDHAGESAAADTLRLVQGLSRHDLLIVLLSGGASSLWPAPAAGLTLADKQATTHLLLKSGATIQEMNAVRRHLSFLKGGRLAAACPGTVLTLALSDVLGDDPSAIGSGPTAPDPTTFADAVTIVQRYGLWGALPARVRTHLALGARGRVSETPKAQDRLFRRAHYHLIGNNHGAVLAMAHAAQQEGLRPLILTTSLIGEAREAAKWFGAIAREARDSGRPVRPPACVIAGGELTVTVKGTGRGGRAQEFALAAAKEVEGLKDTWVVGFGTDGTDGPTDVAGAVAGSSTALRARTRGVDLLDVLARNDSYPCLKQVGGHITTGPTGTNVNDLYALLILS